MRGLFKSFIRTSSFLPKEAVEIVRQPSLLLSLVLGPFLVLALFGISSSATRAPADTLLVVAPESPFAASAQDLAGRLGPAINIVATTADVEEARARVTAGEVDMAVELPTDVEGPLNEGQQADVNIYHNAVDPVEQAYLDFVAYTMLSELNRQVLVAGVTEAQREFQDAHRFAPIARRTAEVLEANPDLRQAAGVTEDEVREARQMTDELETLGERFSRIPADVIVSPFSGKTTNFARIQPNFTAFYGPAVLALLLQHIAISFTALSLVRERILGSTELFRVAPITPGEILTSKYISYLLVTLLLALLLAVLMVRALGVPMIGSARFVVGVLILLAFASLGIGFLISTIAGSEREAVQYSMLVLIAAVFFSGVLFPLSQIGFPANIVSAVLPVTYGTRALQDVMLRGVVAVDDLRILGAMGVGLFGLTILLYRMQFRHENVA